ncbi:hypothetical protein [Companilactobacillus nuruki]|uniref:Uncharacterized protein n=1 Tax=Companilactobacillus nuruki TaxID=1993540 RepID=A0A2N7ASP1_9LACO|nr:hypothetical protein [Companilactobacillus nuruki]PMD68371.1 hypothetical protein CBP76_09970 [Companilactobacillus nuruki]
MEKSFARKLNLKPLFNSLIFGTAIGTFVFILFKQALFLGLVAGILAFLLESLIIYPHYLPTLYGLWKITNEDIYYYDYSTWQKRIQAIFLPTVKRQQAIPFSDIKSYALVVSKKADKWTPHYIVLRIDNGDSIALDLSWNLLKTGAPEKDVEWVVDFITSKLGQHKVEVFQTK